MTSSHRVGVQGRAARGRHRHPSPRAASFRAFTAAAGLWLVGASTAGAQDYRPITGYGNNVANPQWGTPGIHLLRESGPYYADGVSAPAGGDRPNPRAISNGVFAQAQSTPNPTFTDFLWTWGQFLDHDLGLTPGSEEFLPVPVPMGDALFDPQVTGAAIIPFSRAVFDAATGTGPTNPRQQVSLITSFIDGSMVYGSDASRAAWLRTGRHGLLKVSQSPAGDLLPYNDGTQPNAGSPEVPDLSTSLFVGGDVRANEQPTLATMHTLFVREHNFQAKRIRAEKRLNPIQDDETVYQEARRIVIAEIQSITYNEFLPALLGPNALPPYAGYDASVNPGLGAVFSTAAYRLGHTLLSPLIQRLKKDGTPVDAGPLPLRDAFFSFTPAQLEKYGIEPFLRGVAAQHTQELDHMVIDDVRNFLFMRPIEGVRGLDLISLNLQRGREMGLPDFNRVRADFGLPVLTSFGEITSDAALAATLSSLYGGDIDRVDPFVGFLAEDDLPGRLVGPTLFAVLADQFRRARDGDRFWYESTLTPGERAYVERSTLAEIIRRNTKINGAEIQDDVFVAR